MISEGMLANPRFIVVPLEPEVVLFEVAETTVYSKLQFESMILQNKIQVFLKTFNVGTLQ